MNTHDIIRAVLVMDFVLYLPGGSDRRARRLSRVSVIRKNEMNNKTILDQFLVQLYIILLYKCWIKFFSVIRTTYGKEVLFRCLVVSEYVFSTCF